MGSMWLPGVSPAHDIYWSFNSMRHTQRSNEWLGSQMRRNEWNTNFISNNRRRFPAVIGALIDLKQKPNHFIGFYLQVPQKLHGCWNLRPYWLLTWWDFLFSYGVKVVKNLRGLFSESLKLTVHLSPIILRCSWGLHTPKSGVTPSFLFNTIVVFLSVFCCEEQILDGFRVEICYFIFSAVSIHLQIASLLANFPL